MHFGGKTFIHFLEHATFRASFEKTLNQIAYQKADNSPSDQMPVYALDKRNEIPVHAGLDSFNSI